MMTKAAAALVAGLFVFALIFQWGGGVDSQGSTCFGMFGWYTVPCGGWPAVVAGALTAGIAGMALGILTVLERTRGASAIATVAMAVLTGLAVFFVILAPTSGAADHCYSLVAFLGISVPCDGGVAIAGGVAAGGLVALAAWPRSPIARPIPG